MSDPKRVLDTLKAKATLLIQREREVYALRLGRERMMAWLRASQRLSAQRSWESPQSICAGWTAIMIQDLHFQTAAVFELDSARGELSLMEGRSHGTLDRKVTLDEAARRLLLERREGILDRAGDPELLSFASALRMQRLLWYVFSHEGSRDVVLVAGVAEGASGAYGDTSSEDFLNFTLLGSHLAVLLKNAALITELESARRGLQELFDHMPHAIVAFDGAGSVGGVSSRQAKLVFGSDLQSRHVRELLFPAAPPYDIDAKSLTDWIDMAFATGPEDWSSCEPYAPRDVVITDASGEAVPFELEFRPLVRDGAVAQVMLLAIDIRRERELETALRTREAEEAKRAAAMRRLIAGGTQVFVAFLESARERLQRSAVLVQECSDELSTEGIDELFRQAHTIRSEARAFDLVELERAVSELEKLLNELRAASRGGKLTFRTSVERLTVSLGVAGQALDRTRELLAAASPLGTLVFDQAVVSRSVLRELVDLASARPDRLGVLAGKLAGLALGVAAAGVVESAPTWAALAGSVVAVVVEPRELIVPEALAGVLPGVLAHLVRNAIAHGIEPPDDRRAAGKPSEGHVRIGAEETPLGVRVTVEDDGRGIDVKRIQQMAKDRALSDDDAARLIFEPGMSTRDAPDALAGLGVGLDAVRVDLARAGYAARLNFEPGRWTRVAIEPLGTSPACLEERPNV